MAYNDAGWPPTAAANRLFCWRFRPAVRDLLVCGVFRELRNTLWHLKQTPHTQETARSAMRCQHQGLICGLLTCMGLAAPATPVDTPFDVLPPLTRAPENVVTPLVPGRSRTVDLLIEMQDKNGALSLEERSRLQERAVGNAAAVSPMRTMPAAGLTMANNNNRSSGLFGSGVNSAAALDVRVGSFDMRLLSPATTAATNSNSGPQPTSPQTQAPIETGGRLPMMGELLQFIRNHRVLIGLAALAALVLVWAGSAVATQRRR